MIADPANDHPAVMFAFRAEVVARGSAGRRTIAVDDFFVDGFTTVLRPNEIITEVRIPAPNGSSGGAYLKFECKVGDLAIVAAATQLRLADDERIAHAGIGLTSVAYAPMRAAGAERVLAGQIPTENVIKEAAEAAARECDPLSDLRGSADYKRGMVRTMTTRALRLAVALLEENSHPSEAEVRRAISGNLCRSGYVNIAKAIQTACALLAIGAQLGYRTLAMAGARGSVDEEFDTIAIERFDSRRHRFVVVASMGDRDEAALDAALAVGPEYLALVGSRRRYAALADYLRARDIDEERVASIHAPAGLPIHAETPLEIALSVLAEITELRRTMALGAASPVEVPIPRENMLVIDPICGMSADLAIAKHVLEIDGTRHGFCCAGCLLEFERRRV